MFFALLLSHFLPFFPFLAALFCFEFDILYRQCQTGALPTDTDCQLFPIVSRLSRTFRHSLFERKHVYSRLDDLSSKGLDKCTHNFILECPRFCVYSIVLVLLRKQKCSMTWQIDSLASNYMLFTFTFSFIAAFFSFFVHFHFGHQY